MSENKNTDFLSSDKPVTNPDTQDLLGYAPFAKHLADSIIKMAPPEGFVIAIYGSWGSGKSSAIEFIIHYLKIHDVEKERPLVIRFNPWWFSGKEDLIRNFFNQLQATLGRRAKTSAERLTTLVSAFAEIVSEVDVPGAGIPRKLTEYFPELNSKDVAQIKKQLDRELGRLKRRILIVIDDVDRLTAEEIRQLFRMIKAVADFPNVIYLLAFDKDVVSRALSQLQEGRGEEYLDKIVQAPFHLPIPEPEAIPRLLRHQLVNIIGYIPKELHEDVFFFRPRGYLVEIEQFLRTPRDVIRFANTLKVTYAALKTEVNVADLVAIESIRMFFPEVYGLIRDNGEHFAGLQISDGDIKSYRSRIGNLGKGQAEPLLKLLDALFPQLRGQSYFSLQNEEARRRQLRICSAPFFDTYFHLSVPSTSISTLVIQEMINVSSSKEEFGQKLCEMANKNAQGEFTGLSQIQLFLIRFRDYIRDIPIQHIPAIIYSFFEIGDKIRFPNSKNTNPNYETLNLIVTLIYWLLMRLTEPERFEIINAGLSHAESRWLPLHLIATLWHQRGRFGTSDIDPESEQLISLDHLSDIEASITEIVHELAEEPVDRIYGDPDFKFYIEVWLELDKKEAKQWFKEHVIHDEHRLIDFMRVPEFFVPRFPDEEHRVSLEALAHYMDVDETAAQLKQFLAKGNVSEIEKVVVDTFLRTYENSSNDIGDLPSF